MARVPVALYLRIKAADGSWSFAKASYNSKGTIRPLHAVVAGKHEHHPEGVYHLRFRTDGKRPWQPVGTDASLAQVEFQRKALELQAAKIGVAIQPSAVPPVTSSQEPEAEYESIPKVPPPDSATKVAKDSKMVSRKLLSTAIDEYLEEKRLAGKKKKTLSAYTTALQYFRESCLETRLDEIEHVDTCSASTSPMSWAS